jgi:AhpD family alkylhydroperoxidase
VTLELGPRSDREIRSALEREVEGALRDSADPGGGKIARRLTRLGPKMRELIALAVAVTTRCDGCIDIHSKAAVEHGATMDEIAEALGVAVALNAGAAVTYSARVLDAVAALPRARPREPVCWPGPTSER